MSAINAFPAPFAASRRERLVAALASALILGGLGTALVIGLRPPTILAPGGTLVAITTAPERPRNVPTPATSAPGRQDAAARAPRHAAGAPGVRATVTPIMAPRPIIVLLPPRVLETAQPSTGETPTSGIASADAGSGAAGSGSGQGGDGPGGGGSGGVGDGSGRGVAFHARQTRGRLSPDDVPYGLIAPGGRVSVAVRFTITPGGRASTCRVIRSSGSALVDAVPCPLIEARYRFRPARDPDGQPTPETWEETHTWFEPEPG